MLSAHVGITLTLNCLSEGAYNDGSFLTGTKRHIGR